MVQVIQGHKDKKSPTSEVYTYLGLQYIMCMRYELGKNGNLVHMFDLKCQEGQYPLPHVHPNLEYILPI